MDDRELMAGKWNTSSSALHCRGREVAMQIKQPISHRDMNMKQNRPDEIMFKGELSQ